MTETTSATRERARPREGVVVRRTLRSLAVVAVFAGGAVLLARQLAQWAAEHPLTAVLLGAAAVPLIVVFVRGKPRTRELRRAARTGMAEVDAEAQALVQQAPATGREATEPYEAMDADEFENAIARLCGRDGCSEVEVVGGARDLGADVVARTPDGRRLVIQCKRYGDTNKVGSEEVQRFGGTCWTVHGAEVAAIVTTSAFTEPAADYAGTNAILCYAGAELAAWTDRTGPPPWEP